MTATGSEEQAQCLVLEYQLDAPPEKVWRAISIPALREHWLPAAALADARVLASIPGQEIQYRMRDDHPPFLESVVTFQVRRNAVGGTLLRIVHAPDDVRLAPRSRAAANDGGPCLMHAA